MTDRVLRQLLVTLTTLALLAILIDAPSLPRVPVVTAFVMLAPGLAVTRFVPITRAIDQLALGAATSLALNIVVSLALVALGRWQGEPVLAVLAGLTLALAFAPLEAPWTRRRQRVERLHNQEIRARRIAQEQAYSQVSSPDPDQRRLGLMSLSWLLEDDGRSDEAARLRALSRAQDPPRLPLGGSDLSPDARLYDAHHAARSSDPETRRSGLFEVAALLDEVDKPDEADTLRHLAMGEDVPEL